MLHISHGLIWHRNICKCEDHENAMDSRFGNASRTRSTRAHPAVLARVGADARHEPPARHSHSRAAVVGNANVARKA
eukprot:3132840-Pyramimonas_sp.AAC.1